MNLKIQWSPIFETGISEIDFQHKKLFLLVGNVHEALEDYDGPGSDLIIRITLEQLLEYTDYHFISEEKILKSANYSELGQHQTEHENLKDKINVFLNRLETEKNKIKEELLHFLKKWVTHHILIEDMSYIPTLKKNLLLLK